MKRRKFLIHSGMATGAVLLAPNLVANNVASKNKSFFKLSLSGLIRHSKPEELEEYLMRLKSKGYTGVYLLNNYLNFDKWTSETPNDGYTAGSFRLFDIYDFTLSKEANLYKKYLAEINDICQRASLDIYFSFWIPKLNPDLEALLEKENPAAIGRMGGQDKSICTCREGSGLKVLGTMVESFTRNYTQVKGLIISTRDNGCHICDESCPNSHGTSQAEHAANMYECVEQAMSRVRSDAELIVYPWFWEKGWREAILPRLKKDYLVVTRLEQHSIQDLEEGIPGEELFDCSIVSEKVGPLIKDWVKLVGAERIIEMTPVGSSIDNILMAAPPHPGRLFRYFKRIAQLGVCRFIEYDCGSHLPYVANEEAVRLFSEQLEFAEEDFLKIIAERNYKNIQAREWAVKGWKAFDQGFGCLPIGLGQTHNPEYTGRFGFAWTMCVGTPIIPNMFGGEREHKILWFSPYNFFSPHLAARLNLHFENVVRNWQESSRCLTAANVLEGSRLSTRDAAAALAHLLAALSALNFCIGAEISQMPNNDGRFKDLIRSEIKLTEKFTALVKEHPWVWDNSCWNPHITVLTQHGLGINKKDNHNAFTAKLDLMNKYLTS